MKLSVVALEQDNNDAKKNWGEEKKMMNKKEQSM